MIYFSLLFVCLFVCMFVICVVCTRAGTHNLLQGYEMIHAVGRAAAPGREPRLVDLRWAPPGSGETGRCLPRLTLVGKGVTFDTGGLNLKPGDSMFNMKKDMGRSLPPCHAL